jgi:hypothetical protein
MRDWYYFVFVVISISLIFIFLVNIPSAFAQKDQWLNWNDPDNQFTLQYPSNWTITPRDNRFEEEDVLFHIDGNSTTLDINVYNTSDTDIRVPMERSVEANKAESPPFKPKLFEGIDYVKYTVSGKPAGSAVWINDVPFLGKIVWQNIASIVGDKFVGILYTSPATEFDKYLPVVEKVIQSIKVN